MTCPISVSWKSGFQPELILERLQASRDSDGSLYGFQSLLDVELLRSMISVGEGLPPNQACQIIGDAIIDAVKESPLTKGAVLGSVRRSVNEYSSKPERPFWLVTTINFIPATILPVFSVNKCRIEFHGQLPAKYKESRRRAKADVSSWLATKDEASCLYVVGRILARGEHEAAERILDAIDLLRGIWNLNINKPLNIRIYGKKRPVNEVTLGALHTLHGKSGASCTDIVWYEESHSEGRAKVAIGEKLSELLDFTNKIRKRLRSSNYSSEIESAIIRYARALDSVDYSAVVLKLWGILEFLTDTLKESYSVTIKRTLFLLPGCHYHRQNLERLREYRNRYVHSGSVENDASTCVYLLKFYVETLLLFHIYQVDGEPGFGSVADACKFLDLTADAKELRRQVDVLNQDAVRIKRDIRMRKMGICYLDSLGD